MKEEKKRYQYIQNFQYKLHLPLFQFKVFRNFFAKKEIPDQRLMPFKIQSSLMSIYQSIKSSMEFKR